MVSSGSSSRKVEGELRLAQLGGRGAFDYDGEPVLREEGECLNAHSPKSPSERADEQRTFQD